MVSSSWSNGPIWPNQAVLERGELASYFGTKNTKFGLKITKLCNKNRGAATYAHHGTFLKKDIVYA